MASPQAVNGYIDIAHELFRFQPGVTCLICGLPPDVIGIFQPLNPEAWGAMPGKIRLIRYHLCARCRVRPKINEIVEKVIFYETR
jgi:hypothetical protein